MSDLAFIGWLIVVITVFLFIIVWAFNSGSAKQEKCELAGGVLIKGHCVSKSVIIDLEKK